ncbi:MAG: immune inhibitor A [Chloroflexota bacterium]|nr:immune inhibitor A [Chloroflexota bacterium]
MNKQDNNTIWWILGILAAVLFCCCLFVVATSGIIFGLNAVNAPEPPVVPIPTIEIDAIPESGQSSLPTATWQSSGTDPAIAPPAHQGLSATEKALAEAVVPARDLRRLAEEMRGTGPIPEIVHESPPEYSLGENESFWVSNSDDVEHFQIDAELVYANDVLYIWIEQGLRYNLDDIITSADKFAYETYPTNRNFFGSEWSPGIDSDPRLHILHSNQLGDTIAGYYSGADEVSNKAQPFSNEREMFYIHLGNAKPDSDFYDGVLAHEFQHMIHWYQDKNESSWVNEGMSELASELNGYSRGGADRVFSQLPDTQLNTWSDDPDGRTEHYGNAYLFVSYWLDRFGNELTQAVIASDANGIEGFEEALENSGTGLRFDDVFADWVIANLLNDTSLADGRFGYERDEIEPMAVDAQHRRYPVQRESEVHQYATDYVRLRGSGDLDVDFRGATTARLASTNAHGGDFMWWANRVDDSDARLTRAFDLSEVDQATLRFWSWYDIEHDWDYAYVMVSADDGKTWTPMQTGETTDTNPNGNSFGWGITGCSGDPDSQEAGDDCNAKWIEQMVDLTPYTGQEVLVRFQYITDDAVTYPGFFIDDISIPEIGYEYGAEDGDDNWVSEGWIRTDNQLPQRWLIQLIELQSGQEPVLTRLGVDENGEGRWLVPDLGRRKDAILAISALAPVTTEVAPYEYTITER